MSDGSSMVAAATLIGDYARAKMLTALMGGRALTATELAGAAGITKQTGSTHLRKLLDARFARWRRTAGIAISGLRTRQSRSCWKT